MTLTERLQAQLAARAATDPRMRAILRRIQAGTASFSDTALYTRYLGEQLGGILADALPDAAPEEITEAARVLLREAHADVTAQAAIVQEIQDRQLGASLAAKRPKYPAGRVEKVASSLADQTAPIETRQRRARNASANVVASYHDEFIKENARIRSDAGFSCKTVRLGTQCCPWCAKLTGSYPAGSEPRDLFRRHDNCTCTIIYETRRTRQTLRGQGKSWNVVEEVEREAPTRFSRDEAKALQEAELGRYRGLTLAGERGIITGRGSGTGSASNTAHYYELIGKLDPDDKRAISASLAEFERKYKDSPIEHCRVITATGEIYEVHGDRYTVQTTLLGNLMRGSTNEHNHVTGESQYSFSWEDLRDAADDSSKVVIAYDEKYRYHMIFPDVRLDSDTVYEAYIRAKESVGNDLIFRPESISEGDEQHERIRRACEELGIKYSRKELSR